MFLRLQLKTKSQIQTKLLIGKKKRQTSKVYTSYPESGDASVFASRVFSVLYFLSTRKHLLV